MMLAKLHKRDIDKVQYDISTLPLQQLLQHCNSNQSRSIIMYHHHQQQSIVSGHHNNAQRHINDASSHYAVIIRNHAINQIPMYCIVLYCIVLRCTTNTETSASRWIECGGGDGARVQYLGWWLEYDWWHGTWSVLLRRGMVLLQWLFRAVVG